MRGTKRVFAVRSENPLADASSSERGTESPKRVLCEISASLRPGAGIAPASLGHLKRPGPIEKIDQVAFVGLHPVELNCGHWTEIETIDMGAL